MSGSYSGKQAVTLEEDAGDHAAIRAIRCLYFDCKALSSWLGGGGLEVREATLGTSTSIYSLPRPAGGVEIEEIRLWPLAVVIIGSGVKGDRSAASRNPSGASGTWDPNPTRSRLDERNFSKASSRDRV